MAEELTPSEQQAIDEAFADVGSDADESMQETQEDDDQQRRRRRRQATDTGGGGTGGLVDQFADAVTGAAEAAGETARDVAAPVTDTVGRGVENLTGGGNTGGNTGGDTLGDVAEQARSDRAERQEASGRDGNSGPEITDREQQNIDAGLSENVETFRQEQQGLEQSGGRVGSIAREAERELAGRSEALDTDDVAVARQGDTLVASLTDSGREAVGSNPTRGEIRRQFASNQPGVTPDEVKVQFRDGGRATASADVAPPSFNLDTTLPADTDFVEEIEERTPVNFGTSGTADTPVSDPIRGASRAINEDLTDEIGDPLLLPNATGADLGRIQRKGRALARATEVSAPDSQEFPADFGDQYVPESVEQPAADFAAFVERGVSGGLQGTPGVQSTILVPTADGVAAPGIGGEPGEVEQGIATGTGDFVTGVAELPSTAIQVGEAGTFVVGGTGLAGGSREETLERSEAVGERGLDLAQQSLTFAKENPIRFGTSAGLGFATGSAASRVAGGSRSGLLSSTRRTGGTYGSALPDVEAPDVDLRRTLRGDDRGMADFGRTSDQEADTQQESEVTVERGTQEAAEAESSVEEFLEREPANAAFRQENINQGRGPSTPLAEERGLDDLGAEDFGVPSNVERTLVDRRSADVRDRLPDPSEFESREAFEAEVEIMKDRIEAEADSTAKATEADAEAVEAESTTPRGAEATTAAVLPGTAGAVATTDLDRIQNGQQEVELQEQVDTATSVAGAAAEDVEATGQAFDQAQTVTTEMGQELQQGLDLTLQQDVQLATDLRQQVDTRTRLDERADTRLDTDQATDVDTTLRLDTEQRQQTDIAVQQRPANRRRGPDIQLDAEKGDKKRGTGLGFIGDIQVNPVTTPEERLGTLFGGGSSKENDLDSFLD
jgi:hypothetical protein